MSDSIELAGLTLSVSSQWWVQDFEKVSKRGVQFQFYNAEGSA